MAIHYHLGVDGISLFLVLLTTFLTPLAILCSWESIRENVKGFFIAILVIETAMIGVFVSLDLFLFFRLLGTDADPDVLHDRHLGPRAPHLRGVKFILYTMFGSILMLVAILWLYNTGRHVRPAGDSRRCCSRAVALRAAHRTAALRRVLPGVRDQGAALPAAHLAAGRAHRSAHGRLRDPRGRDAEARHLRHPALLPAAFSRTPRTAWRR